MSNNWNYSSGDWWIDCDVCSKKIKASESKKRWDGYIVCAADWETRQPLDFIRARADKISVPFTRPQRPVDDEYYVGPTGAIVGIAVAGQAIVGDYVYYAAPPPAGTFNPNTL